MTAREKLQAIVDGVEPQSYDGFFYYGQILPMLEQAYRLALEDAATFCDNQKYMVLEPLRARTASEEWAAIRSSVKFIGNSLRRMAEQIGE